MGENKVVYYVDEAIDFIYERTSYDKEVIEKILDVEMEYMDSIGLVGKIEDTEE